MQVDTACVTLLTDKGTFIKDGVGLMEPGKLHTTAGVCQWTLVPEKPQAMVVEDMLEDARCAAAWHTSLAPFLDACLQESFNVWDCKMQAMTGGPMAHCHQRFICPTSSSAGEVSHALSSIAGVPKIVWGVAGRVQSGS